MRGRPWVLVVLLASGAGIAALIGNAATATVFAQERDGWIAASDAFSKIVNSGTVWAGLLVLAGWLVPRGRQAAVAGFVAGEVALVVHYALGTALGVYGAEFWLENLPWFVIASVAGPVLGLVGSLARGVDVAALAARLVVPAGAIIEPLVTGMLWVPATAGWPVRVSSLVGATTLIGLGLAGAVGVTRRWVLTRRRSTQPASP